MIPVLQFDPASLTLWYDAHLFGISRGRRELGLAFEYAVVGDDRRLRYLVDCTADPWVKTRAANIASVVWHEKRHFLDFVLTNYGALRIRNFLEVYANAQAIMIAGRATGRFLVPLDSNLDDVTRELAGVGELDPRFLDVARAVQRRKKMLQMDRRPVPSEIGPIEVGGEALMEAIAYHVQMGKTHRVFGADIVRRVQADHPGEHVVHLKYKWAHELMIRTGLLKVEQHDAETMHLDDRPFLPLCYGALAGRFWGQQQALGEQVWSYLPGYRFASLATAMRKRHPKFCDASVVEAWEIVNQTCKEIFGRSVIEETETDFALEERALDQYAKGFADDSRLPKAMTELHELRGTLIALLKNEPELILDQAAWSDKLVNRLQPRIVTAAPGGEIGEPPPGHARVCGYVHTGADLEREPEARWWWAAMNQQWPDMSDPDMICLHETDAWEYVVSEYAPLAKLVYAGQNMRMMLGPELMAARLRFQQQTGVKIVLDPAFMYPQHTHDVAFWRYITGRDGFRCDLSSETVNAPEGTMLDPWDLRLRPGIRRALLGTVENQRRMAFTLWRDWTPWVLSDEFRDYFLSFPVDTAEMRDVLDDA